ncbi:hypothetical protein [Nocardia sp. NPDC005366]|uniref:hypothetical protein n=1 Tax=Nocardia sp. NPDC005366 TaxID=3156878 RepID=UPI00339E9714
MRFGALVAASGLMALLIFAVAYSDRSPIAGRAVAGDCRTTFDVPSDGKAPGEKFTVLPAARHAATGATPVTMADITRGAGFLDEWDTMIVITPGMTPHRLNELTHVMDTCWENLPDGSYDEDVPTTAYYLYLLNGKPLRAAAWLFPTDNELDFQRTSTQTVHPDTVLTPDQPPGIKPQLRVTSAN